MIEFILGAFLYARFKKKYNLNIYLKHWSSWIPLFFGLFYIFLELSTWMGSHWFVPYQHIIKTITLLSYVPLCIKNKLYENKKYKDNQLFSIATSPMVVATFLLWLGSVLNKIVMTANNGMPVFPSNSYWTGYIKPEFIKDGIHILGNAYTNLIPLTDWIDLGYSILSPGDILIRLYVFIIIFYSIKNTNKM